MIVRRATVEDVEAMLDVMEPVVAEGRWLGAEPPLDRTARGEQMRAAMDDARMVELVAEADGVVVGMLGMEVLRYGVAQFGMCVAAEWRGQGVGGALVEAAAAAARELGAHKLSLQVWPHNAAARRLYRKQGFTEEGRIRRHYRRKSGELWDAMIMGRVLDEDSPGSSFADAD